jgi:octaprenyl-diphosphate synthase
MATVQEIRQPVEAEWKLFERFQHDCLQSDNPLQQEVLHYIAQRSGKQLRPLLVLLAAKLCNPVTDKTYRTAVALEMLHNASLVHDDVVDSSDLRRGAPAVHVRWNNKVAVLAGDYMLAKVIGLVAEVRNTQILDIISSLGRSLSSGELAQLHVGSSMWIDEAQYNRVIDLKTARLFQACAEAGAESAGCTQRQRTALREYGRLLGLCFQIKDDIFDYSDLEELGKPTMSDLRDGKVTLPLIIALQRAPEAEAEAVRRMGEHLDDDPRSLEQIKSFVLRFHGDEYAVQQMLTYKKQATEALAVFRDSPVREALIRLLDYAINRVQ